MPKRFTRIDNTLETRRADFTLGIRARLIDGDEGNANADDDLLGVVLVGEESTGLVGGSAVEVTCEVEVGLSETFRVKTITRYKAD